MLELFTVSVILWPIVYPFIRLTLVVKTLTPYAYNLKDLAHYHNLYENLMAHWRQVLPGRFYEVSYEQLTSNQEPESRQLIEYCGLDWQDACLDFL